MIVRVGWPIGARHWSEDELIELCAQEREAFRSRRFGEPQDNYLKAFEILQKANEDVINKLERLFSDPVDPELVSDLVRDKDLFTALRYLGAPMISEDDLKTLVGDSIGYTLVRDDAERAESIRDIIRLILDPKRFPWIFAKRPARRFEKCASILASTVYASSERVKTSRRSNEKQELESAVRGLLVGMAFEQVDVKRIEKGGVRKSDIGPRQFTRGSCVLGEHDADVLVCLDDYRLLAIECKASNSEINSRKRINKEVVQDATYWTSEFGSGVVVPAAVIKGVFNPRYIKEAQETPVVFFWDHRLNDLREFIQQS